MAELRPPLSPTSNNAKRASEEGASQTSKRQRLGDTPPLSGAADQEPPKDVAPCDNPEKKDVDMTRGGGGASTEEVEMQPVDAPEEEAAEEVEENWDEAGWVADESIVKDAVAAAEAAAAAGFDGELTKLNTALAECDALEAIPKGQLTQKAVKDVIKDVSGISYGRLFEKKEKQQTFHKARGRVRPKLQALADAATENRRLAVMQAGVEVQLRLEYEACKALPDDTSDVTISVTENTRITSSHIGHHQAIGTGVRGALVPRGPENFDDEY